MTLSSYVNANAGKAGLAIYAAGFVGKVYSAGPLGGMVSPFVTGFLRRRPFVATERLMVLLNIGAALWPSGGRHGGFASDILASRPGVPCCSFRVFALATSMSLHHLKRPERDFP